MRCSLCHYTEVDRGLKESTCTRRRKLNGPTRRLRRTSLMKLVAPLTIAVVVKSIAQVGEGDAARLGGELNKFAPSGEEGTAKKLQNTPQRHFG